MMRGSSFKRKLISLRRIFGGGFVSFFRNAWLSTAATIVMTITLSSILLTIFASLTSDNTIRSFTDKIDVSIYFKSTAQKSQIDNLTETLKNSQSLGVKEITYISSQEARAKAEQESAGDVKELQAIAQADPKIAFPDSIRVKTLETEKLQEVVKVTRKHEYKNIVDKDSYQDDAKKTAIERLGNIAKFLRNAGLIASVLFGAISILVILNTIRMAIFNRRSEIETMRLLGASKWYIRGPFLVEAGFYGAIAGVLASLFFFLVVLIQAPKLSNFVEEIKPTVEKFQSYAWLIIPVTIALGIFIGVFSAYLAIRKHLKLKATRRSVRKKA